jgi:superoxide reductase
MTNHEVTIYAISFSRACACDIIKNDLLYRETLYVVEASMHNRRDFLKTTAVTASLVAIGSLPQPAAAADMKFKNIIYTKEDPGRWEGKQGTHVPQVTINGSKVAVVTNHPMSKEHFIVRHTLVLADGAYIGSKTFTAADKPESEYALPAGYKGKFYVTSFCNLHDFWLAEATA